MSPECLRGGCVSLGRENFIIICLLNDDATGKMPTNATKNSIIITRLEEEGVITLRVMLGKEGESKDVLYY